MSRQSAPQFISWCTRVAALRFCSLTAHAFSRTCSHRSHSTIAFVHYFFNPPPPLHHFTHNMPSPYSSSFSSHSTPNQSIWSTTAETPHSTPPSIIPPAPLALPISLSDTATWDSPPSLSHIRRKKARTKHSCSRPTRRHL